MLEEMRMRVGDAKARAVDPRKIGCLEMRSLETREARNGFFDQVAIAAQVVKLRLEPRPTIAIRGDRSFIGEERRVVYRFFQVEGKRLPEGGVLNDRERQPDAGEIEGLRR